MQIFQEYFHCCFNQTRCYLGKFSRPNKTYSLFFLLLFDKVVTKKKSSTMTCVHRCAYMWVCLDWILARSLWAHVNISIKCIDTEPPTKKKWVFCCCCCYCCSLFFVVRISINTLRRKHRYFFRHFFHCHSYHIFKLNDTRKMCER